jgi:hypothetical protein
MFAFSLVVVAENRLYTTTNGLCCRLLFGVWLGFGLQAGCAIRQKQYRINMENPRSLRADPLPYIKQEIVRRSC